MGLVRLTDGIIGKTCDFIIQRGILLSVEGDTFNDYARTGTNWDCLRQSSTSGMRGEKGEEPRMTCR